IPNRGFLALPVARPGMVRVLLPRPGPGRRMRACSSWPVRRRSMQLRLSATRDARKFESSLRILLKSPFVVRRNANVNPQHLAGLDLAALSPPQFARRMHHFQVVFARRDIGQAKLAARRSHLIPRMVKHENPGPHRAMKDAADLDWLADSAGAVEPYGVVA